MALILDMDRADAYDIDRLLREGGVINVLIMGGNFMAAERKMSACKHCGAEIAANAKVCPKCGGKNKRPLYKRPWFLVLAALLALAIVGNLGGQSQDPAPEEDAGTTAQENLAPADTERGEEPVYTACSVSEMMELLGNNALKASEQYEGQYMEVTGRLAVIDSDGKYIALYPQNNDFSIIGVQCYIKNEAQRTAVMELSVGDTVTVKGKITGVGEVLGYSLDIDEILPQA